MIEFKFIDFEDYDWDQSKKDIVINLQDKYFNELFEDDLEKAKDAMEKIEKEFDKDIILIYFNLAFIDIIKNISFGRDNIEKQISYLERLNELKEYEIINMEYILEEYLFDMVNSLYDDSLEPYTHIPFYQIFKNINCPGPKYDTMYNRYRNELDKFKVQIGKLLNSIFTLNDDFTTYFFTTCLKPRMNGGFPAYVIDWMAPFILSQTERIKCLENKVKHLEDGLKYLPEGTEFMKASDRYNEWSESLEKKNEE